MSARASYNFNPDGVPLDELYIRQMIAGLRSNRHASLSVPAEVASLSVEEWAIRHRQIDGRAFSLANYFPLQKIYQDNHPFQIIRKPSQVGVSEYLVSCVGHAMDIGARYYNTKKLGLNIGYLFPTKEAIQDFSKERFGSLRLESPHLTSLFTGWDKVTFKQAGESYLYLRGTFNKSQIKTFPVDLLFLDEFDEMNPAAVQLAEKRLRASTVKIRKYISTPTLEDYGISQMFNRSDKHYWHTLCPNCPGEQYVQLDFFRDVWVDGVPYQNFKEFDEEKIRSVNIFVHCPACKKVIPDSYRFRKGLWVPERPDVHYMRGYQVPALSFPSVELVELAVASASPDPTVFTEFVRSDLGLPYATVGSKLDEHIMGKLCAMLVNGQLPGYFWRNVTMGVDVGGVNNYKLIGEGPDGNLYVIAMGWCKGYGELDKLMNRYQVRMCVIDATPEIYSTERWVKKYPGRALRAFYPNNELAMKDELLKPDYLNTSVSVNRTAAMDKVFALLSEGEEVWPSEYCLNPEIVDQMKAPTRVIIKQENGEQRVSWQHSTPDHYYHSSVYCMIARELLPPSSSGKRYSRGKRK